MAKTAVGRCEKIKYIDEVCTIDQILICFRSSGGFEQWDMPMSTFFCILIVPAAAEFLGDDFVPTFW